MGAHAAGFVILSNRLSVGNVICLDDGNLSKRNGPEKHLSRLTKHLLLLRLGNLSTKETPP